MVIFSFNPFPSLSLSVPLTVTLSSSTMSLIGFSSIVVFLASVGRTLNVLLLVDGLQVSFPSNMIVTVYSPMLNVCVLVYVNVPSSLTVIGSFSFILLFFEINVLVFNIIKVIISILMVLITFGKSEFFNKLFYLYIVSIVLGGTLYLINDSFGYEVDSFIFINNSI